MMKARLICVAAALFMTGCFSTKVVMSDGAGAPSSIYDSAWHHGIISGLFTLSDPVEVDKVCPGGVAHIEQKSSFGNMLVATITARIYTPQSVSIFCLEGGRADLRLDETGRVVAMTAIH